MGGDSFDNISQDEESSALEFLNQDSSGNAAFNFAVARVRLRGKTPGAQAIATRVFFRLFQAQTTSSEFNAATTYRTASDGVHNGHKIALLGVQNDQNGVPEYVTIPCFASPRNNLNGPADMHLMQDPPNVQTITVNPGAEVDAYFGCWLDINQPQQKFLPQTPPAAANGGLDGPWNGVSFFSVNEAISRAPHQCLIAELNYDDTPIPPGANSGTSDKLAQRNIAWIDGPNPGQIDSRRMPHPIEIRPTPAEAGTPDELMILWGATPAGSTASVFLPAVNASDILALATSLYPSHRITVVDQHTIQCPASGSSFIPIPVGTARNAGLLTVELPEGIKKGDRYDIVVRQLTDDISTPPPIVKRPKLTPSRKLLPPGAFVWRSVMGAFRFTIIISTKQQLLLPEERLLSVMRWIARSIPPNSRWAPVSDRYLQHLAGRVQGFGGDPDLVMPSPTGDWYRPEDGLGGLLITFTDGAGGTVSDLADIFLKHFTLSDQRTIRRWPTNQPLMVVDLISTNSGIYELQVLSDHHKAVGRFVTINDGQTTRVQLALKPAPLREAGPSEPTVQPVLPSPGGTQKALPEQRGARMEWIGKIDGLIFDRFGDFAGFVLDSEDGEHEFHSRSKQVQELAERAWQQRLRITVWSGQDEPSRALSIIVREPPAPFCG